MFLWPNVHANFTYQVLLTDTEVNITLSSTQHQYVLKTLCFCVRWGWGPLRLWRAVQHATIQGGQHVAWIHKMAYFGTDTVHSILYTIIKLTLTWHWHKELDGISVSMKTELSLGHGTVWYEATLLRVTVICIYVDHAPRRRGWHLIGYKRI